MFVPIYSHLTIVYYDTLIFHCCSDEDISNKRFVPFPLPKIPCLRSDKLCEKNGYDVHLKSLDASRYPLLLEDKTVKTYSCVVIIQYNL